MLSFLLSTLHNCFLINILDKLIPHKILKTNLLLYKNWFYCEVFDEYRMPYEENCFGFTLNIFFTTLFCENQYLLFFLSQFTKIFVSDRPLSRGPQARASGFRDVLRARRDCPAGPHQVVGGDCPG